MPLYNDLSEYEKQIKSIAEQIQNAENLETYREEEDEEAYKELIEEFEPALMDIHKEVANHYPLDLVEFELNYLNPDLEGLLLPRLLGFSVLRGYYDNNYKYVTPQDHFKTLLVAIAESPNFESIKLRIGQTVQIGFALSTDIWITNLLDIIDNKRVKQWLQGQKLEKYYNLNDRQAAYTRYKNQFQSHNYFSSNIPSNLGELKLYYPSLKYFLFQRQRLRLDNSHIKPAIITLLKDKNLSGNSEYDHILFILINFFNLEEGDKKDVAKLFNQLRKSDSEFNDEYFAFLNEMYENRTILGPDSDKRVKTYLDESIKDDILAYYNLVEQLHSKGFLHTDVIEAIREFISNYNGLSDQNESIRQAVLRYFKQWIDNAGNQDYPDFFELFKTYTIYMDLFGNEHFNQQLGHSCMNYIHRLLKYYTDKRGRDYQDIKKFVQVNFVEARFLKEKEVIELFKTRRKPKTD